MSIRLCGVCIRFKFTHIYDASSLLPEHFISNVAARTLCVCVCVGRLLNGKFWIWIALGSFDSQLNLGRMCFICLLPRERERDGVHLTTTVAGSRNRNRSKGSTSIEATFQKWNCICSAWETIITLSPSLLPTPHSTVLSSSNYESTLCALTKIFLLLSFESILGPARTRGQCRTQNFSRGSSGALPHPPLPQRVAATIDASCRIVNS